MRVTDAARRAQETRWDRLERYCRWRQRRFRWHDLPSDVAEKIVERLPDADRAALVEALLPGACDDDDDAERVDAAYRHAWLESVAVLRLKEHVYAHVAHRALYEAHSVLRTHLFVDWSVFARGPPSPVATFEWVGGAHADVAFWDAEIRAQVRRHAAEALPVVRLTAHHEFVASPARIVLHPTPFLTQTMQLLPPLGRGGHRPPARRPRSPVLR